MVAATSSATNELTLSWLDEALKHACDKGQVKLEYLLSAVRAEIVFEMEFGEVSSSRFAAGGKEA